MNAEQDIRFHTMPYTPYTRNTAYVLPVVDEMLAILNDGMNPYKKEITADNLEVLLLHKDGSLSLTSGTLEDSALAKPRKAPQPKPEQPEPEEPAPGEQPEQPPQEPTQGEVEQTQEVEHVQPEEPESVTEQPGQEITQIIQEQVAVLPATPVPVQ